MLGVGTLALLVAGPPVILAFLCLRASRVPSIATYVLISVATCTIAFWAAFFLAEQVLELQFQAIVPGGEWTDLDEQAWSDSDRRIVDAYFGDGGRNLFALYTPILLVPYSAVLWALARIVRGFSRRAV